MLSGFSGPEGMLSWLLRPREHAFLAAQARRADTMIAVAPRATVRLPPPESKGPEGRHNNHRLSL